MGKGTLKDKKITQDKERQAYAFYVSQGWTPEQAIGIVGNLIRESNLTTTIVGTADDKGSQGIAQWHGDRLKSLKNKYGNNWTDFRNQLEFVDWELKNTEKAAGDKLRKTKGVWEAGTIVSDHYERPKVKFVGDEKRQSHVSDLAMKFKGIKLTPEDMPYANANYANSVAPYMNQQKEIVTNTINNFDFLPQTTTFASVPDSAQKENKTEETDKDIAEVEQKTKEFNFLDEVNTTTSFFKPREKQQNEPPQTDYMQQYEQISQFIDNPVAQQGKKFKLKDERNLVQKDNTPNTKRDLSLMLAEYNNAKKDEQELRTTGQIKNPNSIQYRRNIKTQPDIKQDNISTEQRNAPLNPLQRPLIYLANPNKVLGDLGVPNMETSELDRQAINANVFNPNQSRTDRFLNNAKIGLGYVPEATVNTALAAAFMPEGSGALGLVNETLNPLAGTGALFKDVKNQVSLVKDLVFDKNTTLNKNFVFDSKNKIYNQIEEGYKTLDNSLGQKINDLESEEGKRRLINQEKEYLQDFYYDPKNVDLEKAATENADARIEELENIKAFGNKNKEFVYNVDLNKVNKTGIIKPNIESVQYKYDIPTNNAHYQYTDAIIDNPSGSKMLPGKLTLGRGYEDSKPTAFHEINHALQRGRTLKIDNELKSIVPDFKKNLSYDDVNAYTYFKSGSEGQESSSFLAELREQMKKDGFIKNTYDEITPELIEKTKNYYSKNKSKKVFMNGNGLQGITTTRILDFSRPTPENYKIISDAMNKLPAILPIAGASYLATQGQEQNPPQYQQGGQQKFTENELAFLSEIAIKDNQGQRNHPNKVTKIEGNVMATDGYGDIPLYVIPNKGKPKVVNANTGQHKFKEATEFIEIPLFKK